VTRPPPHRSRRAVFPHRTLQVYSRPPSGRHCRRCHPGPGSPNDPWGGRVKCASSSVSLAQLSLRRWRGRLSHVCRSPRAWEKTGVRLAKLPGTPSSLEYPRSLAWSRAHRTPSRRLRFSRHHGVNRLKELRSCWRPVRRGTWACPARSLAQSHSQPRNAPLVIGAGGPTIGHAPRLVRRELPPTLPSLLAQPRVDAVGLCLSLKCVHEFVCVPDQRGLTRLTYSP
jgi:hypothetical protein